MNDPTDDNVRMFCNVISYLSFANKIIRILKQWVLILDTVKYRIKAISLIEGIFCSRALAEPILLKLLTKSGFIFYIFVILSPISGTF